MSLVTFLKIPDVRERFVQQFPKPSFKLKKEILAPPRTNRYMLVGTAFDYLLRFYIKHLNPDAVTHQWFAEDVFDRLNSSDNVEELIVLMENVYIAEEAETSPLPMMTHRHI
jgi:hypothetical protein